MIDIKAKQKATNAIRIARDISDEAQEEGKKRMEITVMDSEEFWAGINLLLTGEWKQLETKDSNIVVLERR